MKKYEKLSAFARLDNFIRSGYNVSAIITLFIVTTTISFLSSIFPDLYDNQYLLRGQEVARALLLMLTIPLILSRLHSIDTGRRAAGPGLMKLEHAKELLSEGLAKAERIWAVSYNSSNFYQAFFSKVKDFKNKDISVLIRHPGAHFIIPEHPCRIEEIKDRIKVSIRSYESLKCKQIKLRGYFIEPVYRGFLLDEKIGFFSFYTVGNAPYRYGRSYKYIGTGGEGWLVKEDGDPEDRVILNTGKAWFSAVWQKFSLPLYPKPRIIFDFDETIADTAKTNINTWKEVLKPQKIDYDNNDLLEWVKDGVPSDQIIDELNIPEEDGKKILEKKRKLHEEILLKQPSVLYHEVYDVLSELRKRGYRMGIASSNSKKIIEECLVRAGADKFFDIIVDREVAIKPSKEVLIHSAKNMGCDIESLVFVGNGKLDAETADNAGVPFILIDRDNEHELIDNYGLVQISDTKRLLNIFNII